MIPFSSRKVLNNNTHATPDNKMNSELNKPKALFSEKILAKTLNNFKTNQIIPINNKRLSLMNNGDENPKKNAYYLQRNVRIESAKFSETALNSFSKKTKSTKKKDAKALTISNFEENVKNYQSEKFNENLDKPLMTQTSSTTSPKHNAESLIQIQNNKQNALFGESKKDGLKTNEIFKSGEWNFQTKKKEFFLNNIINLMNNKMLTKCGSKPEEVNERMQQQNVGKENEPLKNFDTGKEKRQTKIYQYILDH